MITTKESLPKTRARPAIRAKEKREGISQKILKIYYENAVAKLNK